MTARILAGLALSLTPSLVGSSAAAQEPTPSAPPVSPYRSRGATAPNVGFGPFEVETQAPIHDLRLGLVPHTPGTLRRGGVELSASAAWSNVWAEETNGYRIDYETLLTSVELAYGLSDSIEVGVGFQNRNRFGGSLDGLIEGWHELTHSFNDGRENFAQDENVFQLAFDGVNPGIDVDESGTVSQDLLLRVKANLTQGNDWAPALSGSATAKWNVGGESALEGDELDVSLAAAASKRLWQKIYLYVNASYTLYGSDTWAGVPIEDDLFAAMGAVEWNFAPRASFVVQYLGTEGVAEDRRPLDNSTHEFLFGFKVEVAPGLVFDISAIENLTRDDASADFGLFMGLAYRF